MANATPSSHLHTKDMASAPSPSKTFGVKRKVSEEGKHTTPKKPCKYGKDCYRKNPDHFVEFSHPTGNENVAKKQKVQSERADVHDCLKDSRFFLTTVRGIDDKYNRQNIALSIEDILADNADKLEESVQFNYCFDIPWLINKYPKSIRNKPLLLVHGETGTQKSDLECEAMKHKNIDLVQAKLPIPYGTHHSKMMFLLYTNGLKVVIHTANLVESDWFQKTQGIWMSPMFHHKSPGYSMEKDNFKNDLVEYLSSYSSSKLSSWITKINGYDMTSAKVHLIASVPGRHIASKSMYKWGHLKMRKVLCEHGPDKASVTKDWPVIGQFSSIGSLGVDGSKWLCSEWLQSLSCCRGDKVNVGKTGGNILRLIYPTIQNVRDSLEGYSAGGALPYGVQLAMKQRYLKEHLCRWVSNNAGRSLASPHIKSYTRVSPDCQSSPWFLLTSANLSKAAWGAFEKDQTQLMIRSFEIGVLFTPDEDGDKRSALFNVAPNVAGDNQKSIRLPYDVPLTSYSPTDKPWVWDIKYTTEDSHGRLWIPR